MHLEVIHNHYLIYVEWCCSKGRWKTRCCSWEAQGQQCSRDACVILFQHTSMTYSYMLLQLLAIEKGCHVHKSTGHQPCCKLPSQLSLQYLDQQFLIITSSEQVIAELLTAYHYSTSVWSEINHSSMPVTRATARRSIATVLESKRQQCALQGITALPQPLLEMILVPGNSSKSMSISEIHINIIPPLHLHPADSSTRFWKEAWWFYPWVWTSIKTCPMLKRCWSVYSICTDWQLST